MRKHVPAGVADAGIASVASFAAGLTGVTLLSATDRGVYGVFFTAFMLGGILVSELIYVPAQVAAVAMKRPHRLASVSNALRLGLLPSVLGVLVAVTAGLMMRDETSTEAIVALVLTTSATIFVSPMQNHVRKMLHIAERSWDAAKISIAQLVAVGLAILGLSASSIHRAWIPFGSLAIANSISLAFGWLLTRAEQRAGGNVRLELSKLVSSGKWLVLRAAAPAAFAFLAANLLVELAGSIAYGHAEAARQVAQPIIVLATGLVSVLGPHSMRAGMTFDSRTSWRTWRAYAIAITGAGALYLALVGGSWGFNPMFHIVPAAYVVQWLVPVTVVANIISSVVMLLTSELIGAGRTKPLAGLSIATSPSLLIVASTAATTGAFARPLGLIVEGLLRLTGARLLLRHHYQSSGAAPVGADTAPQIGAP